MGTSGSGKTYLARRLAGSLHLPHTELDSVFWQPGWVPAETDIFRQRMKVISDGERWIVDGNYRGKLGEYVARATTVVWLDMPLNLILRRLIIRTGARRISGAELWNGNRERVRDWFSPEHPIWWAIRTHKETRRNLELWTDGRWVRLRSPDAVQRWISQIAPP